MDFSVIFQLRTKKFWWMDVIFYFVISLLIATVFCYLIFLVKDSMLRKQIDNAELSLQTEGTLAQKAEEREVISYQKKISDFSNLLKNHHFASNVFAFMQAQTMPNIWFKQFSLDQKNSTVQLAGESDDLDAFSRQIAILERNEYIKNIGTLNSSLGQSARVQFNINLALDQKIFSYLADMSPVLEFVTASGEPIVQHDQEPPIADAQPTLSSEKLITSFHLLLNPEVTGVPDQVNHTFILNVPYGTNVKNLVPSLVISPGATVSPSSGVSQDFTNPVTYMVTAQNGSAQNYLVSVIVSPQAGQSSAEKSKIIALIAIILIVVCAIVIASFFVWRKLKEQNSNKNY